MLSGKATITILRVELIKMISLYQMNYFSEPYTRNKNKIKVGLDLSNYATKFDVKNVTEVDKSKFAEKIDLNTILDKIFGTKWSNPVKMERERKLWYLFLRVF